MRSQFERHLMASDGGVMTLLHRVVFFGDRMQSVRNLGSLMGFKVVEEA